MVFLGRTFPTWDALWAKQGNSTLRLGLHFSPLLYWITAGCWQTHSAPLPLSLPLFVAFFFSSPFIKLALVILSTYIFVELIKISLKKPLQNYSA